MLQQSNFQLLALEGGQNSPWMHVPLFVIFHGGGVRTPTPPPLLIRTCILWGNFNPVHPHLSYVYVEYLHHTQQALDIKINVVSPSMRRRDVTWPLIRRRVKVKCLLGNLGRFLGFSAWNRQNNKQNIMKILHLKWSDCESPPLNVWRQAMSTSDIYTQECWFLAVFTCCRPAKYKCCISMQTSLHEFKHLLRTILWDGELNQLHLGHNTCADPEVGDAGGPNPHEK